VFVNNSDAFWVYMNATDASIKLSEPDGRADPQIYNASFSGGWQW